MFDKIQFAVKNIFAKKLRTALTVFGIAIGVASVILISTVSSTGIKTVNAELDSLGLNGITVSPDKSDITAEDLELIAKQKGVDKAMPILTKNTAVSNGLNSEDSILWGVGEDANQVISIELLYGRTFKNYDIKEKSNNCLIDESIALSLFKRKNVTGKSITLYIGNTYESFKIIGVVKQGSGVLQSIMGEVVPMFCYIPYSTMQSALDSDTLYEIAIRLKDNSQTKVVSANIKKVFDTEKGVIDSVCIGDLAASRDTLSNLLDTIKVIFAIIGVISLFVAGIGIMTVMLVSVNERTREIGIKKAIGAGFMTIMGEFLFEALTISILGSIIGSVLGAIIVFTGGSLFNIDVGISLSTLLYCIVGACFTGAVFGLYPAFKAAKMKPCEALRYE